MQKVNKKVLKDFEWFPTDFEPDPNPIEIWAPLGTNGGRTLKRPNIELPPKVRGHPWGCSLEAPFPVDCATFFFVSLPYVYEGANIRTAQPEKA